MAEGKDETCPVSTRGGTRLVRLVRGKGGGNIAVMVMFTEMKKSAPVRSWIDCCVAFSARKISPTRSAMKMLCPNFARNSSRFRSMLENERRVSTAICVPSPAEEPSDRLCICTPRTRASASTSLARALSV